MMYPEYVKVNGKKYKINTDFRVAIECNRIATDESIGDYERALAIIYTLYGDEGLNDTDNYIKLLELAKKYLSCNKDEYDLKIASNGIPDMDYVEDMDYIEASFMSDYHIDLSKTKMHWWKFYNLLSALSNSELGNCCILNRIRYIRNYDLSKVEDPKTRDDIARAKQYYALKNVSHIKRTKEEMESANNLLKDLGLLKDNEE